MKNNELHTAKEYFFVRRPVFAIVISIVMIVFGLVSLTTLPISMYPEVVPPEIQVNSTYNGADSVAVESAVTTPLEQKINGVENAIYISSINANDGTSSIRISFEVGSDLDMSNVLVQNRVSEAQSALPEEVKRVGVNVKKSLSFPLMLVTLSSPQGSFDSNFISNYALINLNDELSRIPGVGQVTMFGGSEYAMRVWINPSKIASRGLTVVEVINAIKSQNVISPGGKIGGDPAPIGTKNTYPVKLQGRLESPSDFEEIIVKANPDGSLVRVKDIGRVDLGAQNYNAVGRLNSVPSAILAIYQTPGTNALDVSSQVREVTDRISKNFPPDLIHTISLDTTAAVKAGMDEIVHTLFEAVVLVVLVVYIFLQNMRATIVPILTVPIALISTFAVFPLLGFGVNTLSLLGLILAIGVVVDDAIVVVEAVMHHIEKGLSPREATNKAMEEVSGPVVAMTLILVAVFVPVVFMGGISGRFYEQFAVTIAVSVLFSAISALTLSPALCSLLLKPHTAKKQGILGRFFNGFNFVFEKTTSSYVGVASFFARKLLRTLVCFVIIISGVVFFNSSLPSGFIPEEDQGYLLASIQLPPSTSLQETDKAAKEVEKIIMDTPGIDLVTTVTGFSLLSSAYSSNSAFFFISLHPWNERTNENEHSFNIIRALNKKLFSQFPTFSVAAFGPPAIPGLGTGSGFSLMLQDRQGRSPQFLFEETSRFIAAAKQRPEIASIMSLYSANTPQFYSTIDRAKTLKQGVPISDFNQTMATFLGGSYVNDFNSFGRLYKVYVQAEPEYRDSLEDLILYHVRNADSQMVPLSSLMYTKQTQGPDYTNRFNLYRSAEVTGAPAAGFSSNDALHALEEVAKSTLSEGVTYAWNAMSYQERNAPASAGVLLLGIFFVFLILAAQYNSWSLPFSVLLGTPFAVIGALGGLWLGRKCLGDSYVNNIFAQIGVLTLVGLAAKNAILIVEFARVQSDSGKSAIDAALEAAKLRFRPILMTAFAFILGVIPLVIATGSGAEGRKVMGMAVFSGMFVATIVGVILVPALYVCIEKISQKRKG